MMLKLIGSKAANRMTAIAAVAIVCAIAISSSAMAAVTVEKTISSGGFAGESIATSQSINMKFFMTAPTSGKLVVYNDFDGATTTVPLGGRPWDIDVFENGGAPKLYITDKDNFRVFVVNAVTNASITEITVGSTPIGVAVDNTRSRAFVCNFVSGHVSVIDTTTDTTVGLPISKAGMTKPYGVAVNESTDRLYVSSYDTNRVFVFESSTGTYLDTIVTFAKPTNMSVNEEDNKVYVVHDGFAYLTVIDGSSNTVDVQKSLPAGAQDVEYLPDLKMYFVVSPSSDKLLVFNAATDEQITGSPIALTTGTAPRGVAVLEQGANAGNEPWYLATANSTGQSISKMVIYDTYDPIFSGLVSAADAGDPVTPTVLLTWNEAEDHTLPITYNIYVSDKSGEYDFQHASWTTTATGVISYASAGVDYGDTLWFNVRAKDGSLAGNEDNNEVEFSIKVTDGAPPVGGIITSSVDTSLGREAQLSWSEATDTTMPITYNIYRALSTGAYNWSSPYYSIQTATSVTLSGLTNNTTYYFAVRAEDNAGLENSNANELSVTPTDTTDPVFAGIEHLADDLAGGAINMSWTEATDNSGPVTYNVFYKENAAVTWATSSFSVTAQTSYRLTGLTNGQSYTVGVRAQDTEGNEDNNIVTLTAIPTDSIAPNFYGATACQDKGTGDAIILSWQNASDNSTPISYNVYMATASGVVNYNFASWSYQTLLTTFSATGLTQGQDYWFIVRAEDATGYEDDNINQVGKCAPTDGGNPTFGGIKSAAANGVSGEILLGWDAAVDVSSPITYNVYETATAGVYSATPSYQIVGSTGTTISGLTNGKTYYYRVRAQDPGKREEKNTKQMSAMPNDGVPPVFAGVSSVTNAGTYGAINVSWAAAVDASSPPPITYKVYVSTTPGGQNFSSPSKTTTATSAQLTGLTNGTTYYVVVRATDSGGIQDTNTVEMSATPSDLTGPTFAGLTGVSNTQAGGELRLNWSAASDQSSPITYLIYIKQGAPTIDYSTPSYTTTAITYNIKNLTNGALYYMSVGARDSVNPANTSTNTVILAGTPTDTKAPTFGGLKSAAPAQGESKKILLKWDAATDNTAPIVYNIYYSTSNNSSLIISAGLKATTTQLFATMPVPANGPYYYFIVRASDAYGNTDTNTFIRSAIALDYSPPTFLGLGSAMDTGYGGEIQLSWSAATDESTVMYDIYYSTSTNSLTSTAQTYVTATTTYTTSGLQDDTLYYFAVGARDYSGNKTTNGVILTATPSDVEPPVFSTNPTAADTTVGGEILISWGAADDNSEPITYNIYQSSSSASFDFATPSYTAQNVTSYKIAGLTDGVPLYFVVSAEDSSASSNESSLATVLTATPSDQTAPVFSGLSSVTTYSENGILMLSWSAATDRTAPITYNIYKSMTSGSYNNYSSPTYVVSGTTTYLVPGVLDTRRYYFTVRAEDSVTPTPNEDNNQIETGYTFRDQVGPNQPTDFLAAGGDASPATGDQYIELTWVAPTTNADTLGSALVDLKGYNIYRGTTLGSYPVTVNEVDGKTMGLVPATATQYIDTYMIEDDVTYYYIMVAVDDAADPNYSPPSNQASAKTKNSDTAVPRPPEDLTAQAASGQVYLTWTAPIFNVDGTLLTDLVGYNIWRSQTQGGMYSNISGLLADTVTSYQDTNVVNNTKYYYYMTAIDGGGITSGASLEVNATPMETIDYPPAAPSNIQVTTGEAAVYLSWAAPTKNSDGTSIGSDLDGYNIYRMIGNSTSATKLNASKYTTLNYSDTAVSTGQTYKYYVTALDKAGHESASSSVAVAIIGSRGVTGRIRVREATSTSSSGYPLVGVSGMQISLVDQAGTQVAAGETSADGSFKIVYENAAVGTPYSVRLIVSSGSGYPYTAKIDATTAYLVLATNIQIGATGFTNIVPEPTPIGLGKTVGDVDCDGMISVKDLMVIKPSYNSVDGDGRYDIKADINGDGMVSVKDLMVMKPYYNRKTMSLPPGSCN